jgi:hypothetical protein
MTLEELEQTLRNLLHGKYSSLTLSFNERNGPNYETVADIANEESCNDWISEEEKQKAIAANGVWVLHWYPNTPVSFFAIAASSIPPLIEKALQIMSEEK